MTDNTIQSPQAQETAGIPVRLVRGHASPEELSALVAVVVVLAAAGGDGDLDQTGRPCPASGRYPRSQWGSPHRMVRGSHLHGPAGWRASAFPS